MNWLTIGFAAACAALLLITARANMRYAQLVVDRELETAMRHQDADRVLRHDLTDKRRVWLLHRIAKGSTFDDLYDEDWRPL